MSGQVERLLIFLASPGDVPNERRHVEKIIRELNRTVAAAHNVVLDLVTWEANTFPGHGQDAQAVVNEQIAEMSKFDLFVGLMWNRLGTPTPRGASGTVEEFERAEASLARHARPDIWFYFRDSASRLNDDEQLQQRRRVLEFKTCVEANGLHHSYKTPAQFRDEFRNHLTLWLNARAARAGTAARPVAVAVTPRPENKPDEGLAGEVGDAPPRGDAPVATETPEVVCDAGSGLRRATETEEAGVPLSKADTRLAAKLETGTLVLDSTYYIRRAADAEAERYLRDGEPTVIIRASRQMGKSSLLARLNAQARQLERKSCFVDLPPLDKVHKADLNSLFRHLARLFRRAFGATLDPVQFWDEYEGPQGNITNYLEDAILATTRAPIYVIFDEVESLFETPYRDEFFATVRGWHNLRATNPHFRNLCIIVSHATTPTLWIRDLNQSPFNVGQKINLEGFNEAQVAELNARYGRPLSAAAEVRELVALLNGHAYLTRLALYYIAARNYSLTDLVKSADDQGGPFASHLRDIRARLYAAPELYKAFQSILLGSGCDDEMHYERLWAVGLVTGRARTEAAVSCPLYESYFRRHL